MMADVWKANRPGLGPTDANNFVTGYANRFKYWNLSDRVDYNVTDKLKSSAAITNSAPSQSPTIGPAVPPHSPSTARNATP